MDSARRFRWTLLLAFALMARAQSPCDCIDQADLKERLARVQNAIKAYGEEIVQIGWTPYTAKGRDALQARVETAISSQRREGIKLGAGGHTSNLCMIEVTAPTRCLEESIRRHEQVHQEACKQTLASHMKKILLGEAEDRFEANEATMSGYIMEELLGYQTEAAFLKEELARLEEKCRPRRDYSSPNRSDGPSPALRPPPLAKPKPLEPPPMPQPKPLPKGLERDKSAICWPLFAPSSKESRAARCADIVQAVRHSWGREEGPTLRAWGGGCRNPALASLHVFPIHLRSAALACSAGAPRKWQIYPDPGPKPEPRQ